MRDAGWTVASTTAARPNAHPATGRSAATAAADTTRTLGSQRVRTGLIEFRTHAEPHATSAAIREFDTHTADLLRAIPA